MTTDADLSLAEIGRSIRRVERFLEGVVLRSVWEVQMAALNQQFNAMRDDHNKLKQSNEDREIADRSRNWMLFGVMLSPVVTVSGTYLLLHH